jgi:choline dehydrogenase-like flavoprotein
VSAEIEKVWDIAVLGTGMGGAMAGRRLAEAGHSVLFIERGSEDDVTELGVPADVDGREERANTYAATGGMSRIYGGALERPDRHDIEACEGRPHPTGGWPISYATLSPYLDEMERLFEVRGTADPLSGDTTGLLSAPAPMTERDEMIFARLQAKGAHPYRCHVAMRYVPGCRECSARRCPAACRRDAENTGLQPALRTGNAALLSGAEVRRLTVSGTRVSAAQVVSASGTAEIRARVFILAAGTIGSPRILLASRCATHPTGIGNRHDLVGRGLMCHPTDLLAVWPGRRLGTEGAQKVLGLRDAYFVDGIRLGLIQSLGMVTDRGSIQHALRAHMPWHAAAGRIGDLAIRATAMGLHHLLGSAVIFAGLLEDMRVATNRVTLADGRFEDVRVTYAFPPELLARRARMRREMKRLFAPWRSVFLSRAPSPNWPHACGTLPFGTTPRDSVLDRDCRVHGVDNLFVSDASFMPTSTGANPSLVIGANALRVADAMNAKLRETGALVG